MVAMWQDCKLSPGTSGNYNYNYIRYSHCSLNVSKLSVNIFIM